MSRGGVAKCNESIPLLALSVTVILVAIGCRGPSKSVSEPEITVAMALFPGEAFKYRKILDEFHSISGIKVQLVTQTYNDILRLLMAESEAKRGTLDVVELDIATLGIARPNVRVLSPTILQQLQKVFPEVIWRAGFIQNRLYFIPHRIMWQAMIYNRLRVPKPPENWRELADFAKQHPQRLALKGALYEGIICDAMPFIWEAGGSELNPLSPATQTGLEFLSSLSPYLNRRSPVFREMSILEAQARGEIWIHFNWPFAMNYLNEKGLAPQIDLSAPIPAGPRGRVTILGGGYLGIPRYAPHPDKAEVFLRFFLAKERQQKLTDELQWLNFAAEPSKRKTLLLYSGFLAMRNDLRARPEISDYVVLSNYWQRTLRKILFDGERVTEAIGGMPRLREASKDKDGRPDF